MSDGATTRPEPGAGGESGLAARWAEREAALLREIGDLSSALDAVRTAGIDAVMMPGPDGEQLYALTSTDLPYRVLVEEMGEGAATFSEHGTILYANQRFADLVAHERDRLPGNDLIDLVHSGQTAILGDLLATAPGATAHEELTLLHPDGSSTPVLASVTGLHLDGATVIRCLIVADLTDVMKARQEAKAGEAVLRATLDSLLDPHVRLEAVRDESGQIVDFAFTEANPAACEYNQMTHDEMIGKGLLDLFPNAARPGSVLGQYRQVVETGEPLVLDDFVYPYDLLGGENRFFDIRATKVGDGLTETRRDVTDRHVAAKWLAESEEHFRLLAENASDVVMRLSPDRRFEWVSGSLADVLGWAAGDLLGHVIDDFIHPDELALFAHTIMDTSSENTAATEFRFRRSDGSYSWVLCHTRLKVNEQGTPEALVGGLVDIETRKQVEAREMDRLETLERFQRLTVGRELKMIELKNEIETLRKLVHSGGDENDDKHQR